MKRGSRFALALTTGLGVLAVMRAVRQRYRFDFKGRSVVISGGSRGLGLVLARELGKEGARLTILGRDELELERARRELSSAGVKILALRCDIRQQHEVEVAIAQVMDHYGRIDVLINNAGIIQVGPIEHMQVEDFEDAMATHMWGPLYAMLAVTPPMRRQGGGRIVNISSMGGKVALPHLLPYCASKFALVGLSDGMRAELAKDSIYITTVCPGLMRTGSHVNTLIKGQHQSEYTWFAVLDALSLFSTNVHNAARQIIEACRNKLPQLIITPQARLLILGNTLFPRTTASTMKWVNLLLPRPTGAEGDETKLGWESQSEWVPSLLTRPADREVAKNNQWREHTPIA